MNKICMQALSLHDLQNKSQLKKEEEEEEDDEETCSNINKLTMTCSCGNVTFIELSLDQLELINIMIDSQTINHTDKMSKLAVAASA